MIRYNLCRDRSNPRYFIWYQFKLVICRNFDVRNSNAEIGLENQYDSAKIRMVGISVNIASTSRFNSMHTGKFFMLFCHLLIVFQNQLFRKILSGIPPDCQTCRIQIRPDILSGLIWIQTVCKSCQPMTLDYTASISQLTSLAVSLMGTIGLNIY